MYYAVKGLQVRLLGNFPTEIVQNLHLIQSFLCYVQIPYFLQAVGHQLDQVSVRLQMQVRKSQACAGVFFVRAQEQ